MNTDFIIILDPEIGEETGEPILVASKLNKGDDEENMEFLGVFTGKASKELLDLFLGMKDKEDKNGTT